MELGTQHSRDQLVILQVPDNESLNKRGHGKDDPHPQRFVAVLEEKIDVPILATIQRHSLILLAGQKIEFCSSKTFSTSPYSYLATALPFEL